MLNNISLGEIQDIREQRDSLELTKIDERYSR